MHWPMASSDKRQKWTVALTSKERLLPAPLTIPVCLIANEGSQEPLISNGMEMWWMTLEFIPSISKCLYRLALFFHYCYLWLEMKFTVANLKYDHIIEAKWHYGRSSIKLSLRLFSWCHKYKWGGKLSKVLCSHKNVHHCNVISRSLTDQYTKSRSALKPGRVPPNNLNNVI